MLAVAEKPKQNVTSNALSLWGLEGNWNPQNHKPSAGRLPCVGTTLSGLPLYTKGKLIVDAERETYYFLISSKRAES